MAQKVHHLGASITAKKRNIMKCMLDVFWISCLHSVCRCSFDGRVVAKLPFVPISWLQNISHRNLLGEDYTDCSFIFLYILCTMSIRQVCHLHLTCRSTQLC